MNSPLKPVHIYLKTYVYNYFYSLIVYQHEWYWNFQEIIEIFSFNIQPIETNPFVQATFNSVIKVENGLIKAVDIKEHYNFQPLGNYGETLTSVAVTIKITQYAKSKDGFSLGMKNYSHYFKEL